MQSESFAPTSPDGSLNHKFCQIGETHSNKQILMVCLNTQCDARRLCCLECIDEFHKKHELISLHKFEQMLSELSDKQRPEMKGDIVDLVRQFRTQVRNQLNQTLQRCINDYESSIKIIETFFQQILARVDSPENASVNFVDDFYSNFTSKNTQAYFKKIIQAKCNNFQSVKSTLSVISKSEKITRSMAKDFQINFTKNMEFINKGIQNLKKCFTEDKFIPFQMKFSKVNKATCLTTSEDQLSTKRTQGTGGYPINLMEHPLTRDNCEVKIKITEEPGNKGIWMGVAILNIVKQKAFLGCYGLGKGTYAIDQVGANHASAFSWNNHDSAFNSQPKVVFQFQFQGFQFNQGDVIKISVDFDKNTVTFEKGSDTYTQPIKLDLGDIYAFAGPTNLGDALALELY